MSDKKENINKQEEKMEEVFSEIKEIYDNSTNHLEENIKEQLNVASDLKEELGNTDFDKNIEQLQALRDEISKLKSEIGKLNDMKDISFSSLIIKDVKAVGEKLSSLQTKAVDSIKNLYGNIKNQLSYNLTKVQEKFVQAKISIVKGLVSTMRDFIKNQQQKLNDCMEKLDGLAEEIKKDEKEIADKESTEKVNAAEVKTEIKPEIKEKEKSEEKEGEKPKEKAEEISEKSAKKEQKKTIKKEKQEKKTPKKTPQKTSKQVSEKANIKEKAEDIKLKRKPSVLQALKENQKKIMDSEKTKEEKAIKKDKGMEI